MIAIQSPQIEGRWSSPEAPARADGSYRKVGAFSLHMNALYLIAGGSLGTLARYYVTGRISDAFVARGLGVFVVNIVGSFIIGLFLTLSEERFLWPSQLRLLVAVGFLGAFTTFSSLTWETLQMLELRDVATAALNIGGSVTCGLLAVYLGTVLGRTI